MEVMPLNYVAVLVCAVVMFMLGGLWYSPALFAKQWMELIGKSKEELKNASNATTYVRSFILGLMSCYVLANMINFAGATTVGTGAMVGFVCWAGFNGAPTYNNGVNFMKRPIALWGIDSGYILVSYLVCGAILALWR